MTSAPRCRAEGGASNCTDPDCPEKRAGQADFFGTDITSFSKAAYAANKAEARERKHKALSDLMDFGHTVSSDGSGSVTDRGYGHSPLVDEIQYVELDDDGGAPEPTAPAGWEYLRGFTGQYGYSGAIMHSSELIGGALADHILENPGFYAAVAIEADINAEDDTDPDFEPIGWGILHRIAA